MKKTILLIEGTEGFITKAIHKKLAEAGFDVVHIRDDMDEIFHNRNQASIIFYYLSADSLHMSRVLHYLLELCQTEHKTLCIGGDAFPLSKVLEQDSGHLIRATFQRPINIPDLVRKMQTFADNHTEFSRRKSILVIDDDIDFLQIIDRWLRYSYQVDAVRSGTEALKYLTILHPDLILLDYEMPEFDGYQVLDLLRRTPSVAQIPIVFLTGKNDRETVMRILNRKPDGYLLKSMGKEELLDSLDRFFAANILSQNAAS